MFFRLQPAQEELVKNNEASRETKVPKNLSYFVVLSALIRLLKRRSQNREKWEREVAIVVAAKERHLERDLQEERMARVKMVNIE